MKLYLLQHGDSLAEEVNPERPLSEAGMKDIEKLGKFLEDIDITFSNIFHSGKLRAKQTAEMIAKCISYPKPVEAHAGLNPNDEVFIVANELDKLKGDTLLVGHLPYMSKLVGHLVSGEKNQTLVSFEPGTLVCLEKTLNFWAIYWIIRPQLI